MRTVELFSGHNKSFSKVAQKRGHEVFTVDIKQTLNPDLVHDLNMEFPEILKKKIREADFIWMSPPCTTFSMAGGNTHWNKNREPKTVMAENHKKLLLKCLEIGELINERGGFYAIENPRARARWFLPEHKRHTVWYCQYGMDRAKSTDIWTNVPDWKALLCKNGRSDHISAPRGSQTGTQGRTMVEKNKVPKLLVESLLITAENVIE